MMKSLFGQATSKEEEASRAKTLVREWQRKLRGEMRGIERQVFKIEREEEKLKKEIKMLAKKGETGAIKHMAKELVRSRKAKDRMHTTRAQLNSIAMELQVMASQMKMADCMRQSATVMSMMTEACKAPEIAATMSELSREMAKAGLIEEAVEEAIDAMDEDDMDEMAEEEMARVLEEVAGEAVANLVRPGAKAMPKAVAAPKMTAQEEEMMRRMEAL